MRFIFGWLICAFAASTASPQCPPITDLGRNADVVALATIDRVIQPGSGEAPGFAVQLKVSQLLKGHLTSTSVTAGVPMSGNSGNRDHIGFRLMLSPELAGKTGLWFLKSSGQNYEILP